MLMLQKRLIPGLVGRWCVAALLIACSGFAIDTSAAGVADSNSAGNEFFEKKIRPTLVNECYKCHAATSEKIKGNLQVDSLDGLLSGGDTGPAIVPGDPDASLLMKVIKRVDKDTAMPPKKELSKDVVNDFATWIKMGAPWPGHAEKSKDDFTAANAGGPASKYDALKKELWSWQAIAAVRIPKVESSSWVHNDIDRFILKALEDKGLKPSLPADKLTLLRRATYDLTGLPPTSAEIDAFSSDTSADAFAKVVDRLLASPRFGERWGRHWLDVARYAESTGMSRNYVYFYAWRFRDYVIKSFNTDKPFNTFISEQLAGDLMPYQNIPDRDEKLIATGFLSIGTKDLVEKNRRLYEMNVIDEQIDATTRAFLATTVACARCHDHKFDPIPTAEYYSLAGIFGSTEDMPGMDHKVKKAKQYDYSKYLKLSGHTEAENKDSSDDLTTIKNATPVEKVKKIKALKDKISSPTAAPAKHFAMGVTEGRVGDGHILIRGEVDHLGPTVHRGFLNIPCMTNAHPVSNKQSGRLELAQWITDPQNPLTTRVAVNRIWSHLFGFGIVRSVDNFGLTGERPSNPELLDHLASQFMNDGWSTKKMVRQIMLSATYQQASTFDRAKFTVDPENTMLWRMNQRRLEAEAIRDGVLAASGKLTLVPPTASFAMNLPEIPIDIAKRLGNMGNKMSNFVFRSVYLPIYRNEVPEGLEVFDMADPNAVDGRRDVTTVAPQALYMMNSGFILTQSKAMVERLANSGAKTDSARIDLAYKLSIGRLASSAEKDRALTFVNNAVRDARGRGEELIKAQTTAWSSLCQALFASAEFRYLN